MRRRSKLRLSRVQAGLPCQPRQATRAVSTSALPATTVGTTLSAAIGTALAARAARAARATPATAVNGVEGGSVPAHPAAPAVPVALPQHRQRCDRLYRR